MPIVNGNHAQANQKPKPPFCQALNINRPPKTVIAAPTHSGISQNLRKGRRGAETADPRAFGIILRVGREVVDWRRVAPLGGGSAPMGAARFRFRTRRAVPFRAGIQSLEQDHRIFRRDLPAFDHAKNLYAFVVHFKLFLPRPRAARRPGRVRSFSAPTCARSSGVRPR